MAADLGKDKTIVLKMNAEKIFILTLSLSSFFSKMTEAVY